MNKRTISSFVIAIVITSICASASPARADLKPTPTPISSLSPVAQYEAALQQYKVEMKMYLEARSLREQQLREILNDFNRALRKATEDARIAGKSAGSKATLASARAAAATARDEAVALLGPEPVAPTPPIKPMRDAKVSAPGQKPGKKN